MIKYQYQLIRFMPDQFTGEFANVGIVLYAPQEKYLACKVTTRYSRLTEFFGDLQGQFLINGLRQFETSITKISEDFKGIFESNGITKDLSQITTSILPKDDSALQLSEVFRGRDVEPQITMADLFERVIEKYYNLDTSSPRHTDQYAWSKVYKTYFDKYGVTRKLKKHTVSTSKDAIDFDRAWKNGVWNCYEALSFDLKSEDAIKSKVYKWSGIIRELETTKESFNLYFLTTSPKQHKELEPFIKETLVLKNKNVKIGIVQEDEAEEFACEVRKAMEKSDVIKEDELPF